jgi:endonuclease-8
VVPEGDTLHRTATRLRPALVGRELERVELPRVRGVDRLKAGDVVTSVESRGKFLEIEVERGLVLRTHLRMTGSWHLYRSGERWRKPAHLARAVLGVSGWVAVCFAAPVVEVGREGDGRLDHLGPDLCRPDVDISVVVARLPPPGEPGPPIAEVLLDQTVAAGIGNVYKSEVLHACRVNPFDPVGAVDSRTRERLYETAHRMLTSNLDGGPRETVPGGLAVYGRTRRPCRVCGTPIEARRHGDLARTTYWCPLCQPPGS